MVIWHGMLMVELNLMKIPNLTITLNQMTTLSLMITPYQMIALNLMIVLNPITIHSLTITPNLITTLSLMIAPNLTTALSLTITLNLMKVRSPITTPSQTQLLYQKTLALVMALGLATIGLILTPESTSQTAVLPQPLMKCRECLTLLVLIRTQLTLI